MRLWPRRARARAEAAYGAHMVPPTPSLSGLVELEGRLPSDFNRPRPWFGDENVRAWYEFHHLITFEVLEFGLKYISGISRL